MHKIHLLKILAGAPDNGMLAFAVRREMNATAGIKLGDGEFRELINDLLRAQFITAAQDPIFGDSRLSITEYGRTAADGY